MGQEHDGRIQCHTCGARVTLVRSVRIRQELGEREIRPDMFSSMEEFVEAEARGIKGSDFDLMALATAHDMPLEVKVAQLEGYARFRRGFVCLQCYNRLARRLFPVAIKRGHTFRLFRLASDSAFNKAAVYDHIKWVRYQAKLARTMGIDVTA
jgi:hypothetical protein